MNSSAGLSIATVNDDIGEAKRLKLYRAQLVIREADQRAYDLLLQNLVKGTSHVDGALGAELLAAIKALIEIPLATVA